MLTIIFYIFTFLPFFVGTNRIVSWKITPNTGTWLDVPDECRLVGINQTGHFTDVNNIIRLHYNGPIDKYVNENIWIGAYEEYSPHIRYNMCFKDSNTLIKNNAKLKYKYDGNIYNINICINMCLGLNITAGECNTIYIDQSTCFTGLNVVGFGYTNDPDCIRYSNNPDGIQFTTGTLVDNCVCQYSVNNNVYSEILYIPNANKTQMSRRLWGEPNPLTSYKCMTYYPYQNALNSSVCSEHHRFACEDGLTKWIPSSQIITTVQPIESTLDIVYRYEQITHTSKSNTIPTYTASTLSTDDQAPLISTNGTFTTENSNLNNVHIHHDFTKSKNNSLSVPTIAGIVCGCLLLLGVVVLLTVFYHINIKRKQKPSSTTYEDLTQTGSVTANIRNQSQSGRDNYAVLYEKTNENGDPIYVNTTIHVNLSYDHTLDRRC